MKQLLSKVKFSVYKSLQQAKITYIDEYIMELTFTVDFFKSSFLRIQRDISDLLTDVTALRMKALQSITAIYQQALEEFKVKLTSKLSIR